MVPALDSLMTILRTPEVVADVCRDAESWTEIKRLAEIHRFTGQLAYSCSAFLPPSERQWRDQVLMTHHHRHTQRLAALRKLIEAFAGEDVTAVSVKGPLLAERYYSQPYLRPCKDLDILVHERDVGRAARVMLKLGFRLEGSRPWSLHQDLDKDLEFHPAGPFPQVEVLYRLKSGGMFFSASEFVDRACIWRSSAGFESRVLPAAEDAFYCGFHAANHAFHRLRWLYDTIMIARGLTNEERIRVRELTLRHGQTGAFIAAAFAAQEFFGESPALDYTGFPIPRLLSRLTAHDARRMVERVEGNTATVAEKIGYRLDLCRMAGSPLKAAKLLAGAAGLEIRKRWYDLGHRADPEALARTLPD